MSELLANFIDLFIESAPWLLLGLLIAGLIKFVVPTDLLNKHLTGNNLYTIFKAALIGAPLPLCSCGVIPAALGLRKSGASAPATISFLVSTPETGVDSVSVSYALLGPFMAIIRPISAIITAIVTGFLVMISKPETKLHAITESCCSSGCCGSNNQQAVEQDRSLITLTKKVWDFSTGELLNDFSKWLLIGLLFAAIVKTWVPEDFLTQWGSGLAAMLVMALIGIPMYICATASTPVAAGFLAAGVSPGAVLVFLLAGPATNIATMGMIKQEFGEKVMLIYVSSIIVLSILMGLTCNWMIDIFSFTVLEVAAAEHELLHHWTYLLMAIILAVIMLKNLLLKSIAFTQKNEL